MTSLITNELILLGRKSIFALDFSEYSFFTFVAILFGKVSIGHKAHNCITEIPYWPNPIGLNYCFQVHATRYTKKSMLSGPHFLHKILALFHKKVPFNVFFSQFCENLKCNIHVNLFSFD